MTTESNKPSKPTQLNEEVKGGYNPPTLERPNPPAKPPRKPK